MTDTTYQIQDISTFGYTYPKKDSWKALSSKASSYGWKSVNIDDFQKKFNDNVEACYYSILSMEVKNLDNDQVYWISFDNGKKQFYMSVKDSPVDALDEADFKAFKTSKIFKNTCKRADELITNALKSYEDFIEPEIKNGTMIEIDEVKLEALIHFLKDPSFRSALKRGVFSKKIG